MSEALARLTRLYHQGFIEELEYYQMIEEIMVTFADDRDCTNPEQFISFSGI